MAFASFRAGDRVDVCERRHTAHSSFVRQGVREDYAE